MNTYAYDTANRLTSIQNQQSTIVYRYDGLGNRLQQTIGGVTTTYTLDLASGLTQVLSDGTNTYLYGNGRIAQQNGPELSYFLGDALGSVRQLTDADGTVTLANFYDPYGALTASVGTGQTAYGYTGEQQDSSTGMIYLRARYYAPGMGRFMTQDTNSGDVMQPVSFHKWLYVQDNPINFMDHSGHDPYDICSTAADKVQCYVNYENNHSFELLDMLKDRTKNPANYPAYLKPPLINFDPTVSVNLASDLLPNHPSAEEDSSITPMGTGLCGQIALEMVLETITGHSHLLSEIYHHTNPANIPSGTLASSLVAAVFSVLDQHSKTQESNWRVTTYGYSQILTYTSAGNYWEQESGDYWYGDANGSLIAPRIRRMLQLNHYVLALATMMNDVGLKTNPWGTLAGAGSSRPTVGHWVVVTGMSSPWDYDREDSSKNWVRINNSYSNQEQYYPWWYFKDSMFHYLSPSVNSGPVLMDIWHDGDGAPDVAKYFYHPPSK
jgi:RHS repeat-associated protein